MVPEPAAMDHVAVIGTACPAASRPVAVNCCVLNTGVRTEAGVTSMDASGAAGAAVTVTVAPPLTSPFAALMMVVSGDVAAVNSPELVIVPLPLMTDHVGVNATTLPAASFPVAVNRTVSDTATLAGLGRTVIAARTPGGVVAALTTTVADPEIVPLVARITDVPGAASAVKTPVLVTTPLPLATDQVGVMETG